MSALDPEVANTVFEAVARLIPDRVDDQPLGCHWRRVPDRVCFEGILIRLALGCSREDTERSLGHQVSHTTLRARRDEWIRAGVFEALVDEAITPYDNIIRLDLSDMAIDGANHRNVILVEPTLADVEYRGDLADIDTLHPDRRYDSSRVRSFCDTVGISELDGARRRKRGTSNSDKADPLKQRWTVERTNSWLTTFGQLKRNTERQPHYRGSQLALAIKVIEL